MNREEIDITKWVWKTKDQRTIRMIDMDLKHLQSAHTHSCIKELEYHNLGNIHNQLREQLERVAEIRGIKLQYPDERFPARAWGEYFVNVRKVDSVTPQPIKLSSGETKGVSE
jgi:hypothetical protein